MMGSCSSKPGEVGAMPIAGVGRVEPMDPVVKREVMRRARESGTFATEPDAAWVGSPLPASVNRRVVSRDATKRPAGPDAPTSSSHFGATVAPRTLDYDGSGGRGSFSGAAVHPTPSDDAPSPDRVEAFRGMSPTPESPAGFGAGRLPWGSIDLTERVPTPTTEYVDTRRRRRRHAQVAGRRSLDAATREGATGGQGEGSRGGGGGARRRSAFALLIQRRRHRARARPEHHVSRKARQQGGFLRFPPRFFRRVEAAEQGVVRRRRRAAVPGGGSPRRKSRARCAAFARRKARPRGNRPRPRRPTLSGSSRGWSLVRTTRFIASPRWTRVRSLRGRLTRCSAAAPR